MIFLKNDEEVSKRQTFDFEEFDSRHVSASIFQITEQSDDFCKILSSFAVRVIFLSRVRHPFDLTLVGMVQSAQSTTRIQLSTFLQVNILQVNRGKE